MSNPETIFLAGPTAAGKSAIALYLAERIGGEIISVDSMQVYRGLDIGTAKPSAEDRRRVPHHLVDVVELAEAFDAAEFVKRAKAAVAEIQGRGHVPIFCGGTGLYFKAYLDGLGEAPSSDPDLRIALDAMPQGELLRELEERDPVTYERIDRNNPRRVVRAVEVIRLTGKPYSEQRANWRAASDGTAPLFGCERAINDLRTRIDARVDEMFQRGLVAETEQLVARGLAKNKTAMQAIGYRQAVEHLNGVRSLPETIVLVKQKTRQFAKRQMTWFRRQLKLNWIKLEAGDAPEAVAERMATQFRFAPR